MAEEKKEEAPAAAEEAEGGSGFSNKLVVILSVVNTLAVVAMAVMLYLSFEKQKKAEELENVLADSELSQEGGHGEAAPAEGGHGEASKGEAEGEHGGAGKPKTAHAFGIMVTLEQFTVNLVNTGTATPKFARVDISVEVPNEDTQGEIGQKMPQVRNAIIDLFNSKRPADLATVDGRNYLKDEIKNALNSFLVTGKVKGVFFTSFAISG